MLMDFRGLRAGALVCAAAGLALAPTAQAAAPEPCDGTLLIKDAAGDQAFKVNGNPAPNGAPKPGANVDATGVFFRTDAGKVTANIVISDLTKTLPQGFEAARYRVYVTVGGSEKYLEALVTAGGVAYSHGIPSDVNAYEKSGDTTGTFTEGKNGVVQILLPPSIGGKAGTKLDAVAASIGMLASAKTPTEAQTAGTYWAADSAPDASTTIVNTTAPEDCPVAEPPAPVVEAPAPVVDVAAPPASPQPVIHTAPFLAPGDLQLSLARSTVSARKAKRRVRLSLRSTESLQWVTIKLVRGARVLSRVDMDAAGARTTVALKLRRKLAARPHALVVSGTRPDGTMFTSRLPLRVTR